MIADDLLTAAYRRDFNCPTDSEFLELTEPNAVVTLIQQIIDRRKSLEQCVSSSYRHALGFDKFVLAGDADKGLVRLHVWQSGDKRRREDIHDHRFRFTSRVLAGELECEQFFVSKGNSFAEFNDVAPNFAGRWEFRMVGARQVSFSSRFELHESASYALSEFSVHRISVPTGISTFTIIVQSPLVKDAASVYTRPSEPPSSMPQEKFSVETVVKKLTAVQKVLKGRDHVQTVGGMLPAPTELLKRSIPTTGASS